VDVGRVAVDLDSDLERVRMQEGELARAGAEEPVLWGVIGVFGTVTNRVGTGGFPVWASASRMFTWCRPKNGKQTGPDTPRYGSVTLGS
jgi:hypothetical protein